VSPGAEGLPATPAESARAKRARSLLLRAEAAAVLVAALLSIIFYLRLPSALPSQEDYQAVAARVDSLAGEGDAVLLDPWWAERARLFVKRLPVLDLGRKPSREDLAGYRRLFVLSLPELPRSDRAATFRRLESLGFSRSAEPEQHGSLSITIFENRSRELPSFDFTAQVADARVYIRRPDGSEEICPRRGARHPCPRASWIDVGAETKEIAFKPYRCVWAHPAGREPLVVEYSDVLLGKELRVLGGIVGQIAFRTEHYGTTLLDVKIDGAPVGSLTFPPGEPGERRRAIDTSQLAGTRHTVQLEISASNPDMRHFCFDAGVY
jgi:hypothetical protein